MYEDNLVKEAVLPAITASSGLRSWAAVFSLTLGAFGFVSAEFLPVGVLPEIAQTFQVEPGRAGLMLSMPGILAALSGPAAILLPGRIDRRRLLQAVTALLVAACILNGCATSFNMILASRAMVGMGLGAFWAVALAVAGRMVSAESAHKAAGAVFAGVTAAMILGVPIGTYVSQVTSWRGAFAVAAAIGALAFAMQMLTLPKMQMNSTLHFSSLIRAAQNRDALKSMALIGLVIGAHFASYTFVTPIMRESGINGSAITAVLFAYGVAGFISNVCATYLVGRDLRRTLSVSIGLMFVPVCALPLSLASASMAIALVVCWGTAMGAIPLCLSLWNAQKLDGREDAASALFAFVTQVAIALGSSCGGVVVDTLGLHITFWAAAAMIGLAGLLLRSA
ncbi:MFS transporter [Paraburkholderia bannensis]|uniref:MFS transporter n=1 Tax=Paraburkholderia bannensis TaxID=765414 RepID=UPI002ABDD09E|nr:MFS transporter [Paraburkholderia bannensis]